jgi:formylglycine-generating enzyme required for sulfatase activity
VSDVFLSYAHDDLEIAKRFAHALQQLGWDVWWDPAILPGNTWHETIERVLDAARCVIVLWSKASIESSWVLLEAEEGRRRRIFVPILLDNVTIPLAFRGIQAANLIGWSGALQDPEFCKVADVISKILEVIPRALLTPTPGQVRQNPIDGLEYAWIPPGQFRMGCPEEDSMCHDCEKPAHEVEIKRGFWIGKTPVTQRAYQRVIQANPSYFQGAERPVENVSWVEAKAYCDAVGMRLPTEAEWEYAARAGSTKNWYDKNLDKIAWSNRNCKNKTHPVALKQPNAWGLYDTLGNVWEWCSDWYGPYQTSRQMNPVGPSSGYEKVLRGHAFYWNVRLVRVWDRGWASPATRHRRIGFRCAWDVC